MHEERIDRIGEIEELQPLAGKRALLNGGAGRISLALVADAAHVRQAHTGSAAHGFVRDILEVRRPAVDRDVEPLGRHTRAVQHRLEVAGQQPFRASMPDAMGQKVALEKCTRVRCRGLADRRCITAGGQQARRRRGPAGRCPLPGPRGNAVARLLKRFERCEMVVARPARQILKSCRLECGQARLFALCCCGCADRHQNNSCRNEPGRGAHAQTSPNRSRH